MRNTYLQCDNPEAVKTRMLARVERGSYAVPLVLRNGWEAWVKSVRDRLVNFAIVSALVLSVMVGQVFSPPTSASPEPIYETLRTIYVVTCAIASCAAILSVLGVTLYLKYCEMFVVDLGDFFELHAYFHPRWSIEGAYAIALLCSGMSIGIGLPLVLEGPGGWVAASVFGLLTAGAFGVWFVRGKLFDTRKKRIIRMENELYKEVVENVYRELYTAAGADAGGGATGGASVVEELDDGGHEE